MKTGKKPPKPPTPSSSPNRDEETEKRQEWLRSRERERSRKEKGEEGTDKMESSTSPPESAVIVMTTWYKKQIGAKKRPRLCAKNFTFSTSNSENQNFVSGGQKAPKSKGKMQFSRPKLYYIKVFQQKNRQKCMIFWLENFNIIEFRSWKWAILGDFRLNFDIFNEFMWSCPFRRAAVYEINVFRLFPWLKTLI